MFELNDYAKRVLTGDPLLRDVRVAGEISGYKHHYASGHRYFSLKDANATINCVMYKSRAMMMDFEPRDGMRVVIRGYASIFPRDGRFQFYADVMQKEGVGDLYLRFEALKEKLKAEGLFDTERKRPLPYYPKCIGIATSADGAALRDMVRIAKRRDPNVRIIVAPCSVQGASAVKEITEAIERLNADGRPEVLLCGRGGGSMEDLWCFNEEAVARSIYHSRIPVISCVGHETDTTIADFVADRRAATPSMAAEIAVPIADELRQDLRNLTQRVAYALRQGNEVRRAHLNATGSTAAFRFPRDILIEERRETLDRVGDKMITAMQGHMKDIRGRLTNATARLNALDPASVLLRGYACVSRDDTIIDSARQLNSGDQITVRFSDGSVKARVND